MTIMQQNFFPNEGVYPPTGFTSHTFHVGDPARGKRQGKLFYWGILFYRWKNVVDNYALRGNGITSFSVPEPIDCFAACRLECRCISFNYKQTQNLCQLNEESRYTNASALGFAEGWQYYDLVIDYNVQVGTKRITVRLQVVNFLNCRMLIMIFPKQAYCTKLVVSSSKSEEISNEIVWLRLNERLKILQPRCRRHSPIFVASGKRGYNKGSRRCMHAR